MSQYLWIAHWPKIVSHNDTKIKIWYYKIRMFCLAFAFSASSICSKVSMSCWLKLLITLPSLIKIKRNFLLPYYYLSEIIWPRIFIQNNIISTNLSVFCPITQATIISVNYVKRCSNRWICPNSIYYSDFLQVYL